MRGITEKKQIKPAVAMWSISVRRDNIDFMNPAIDVPANGDCNCGGGKIFRAASGGSDNKTVGRGS